eukprot:6205426-Pleurochrysis_carterae.AAC.1
MPAFAKLEDTNKGNSGVPCPIFALAPLTSPKGLSVESNRCMQNKHFVEPAAVKASGFAQHLHRWPPGTRKARYSRSCHRAVHRRLQTEA